MNNNEPIVLGKVKKSGGSKPILVIIIFLFIGSIILFIPTIANYFGDYNVIDLIKNGEIIDFITNHDSYIKKGTTNDNNDTNVVTSNYINSKTIIKSNGIILNEFNLTNENISFKITNNNIDLDKLNYYLILKQNNKELYIIKLTNESNIEYIFNSKLNSLVNVEGIIKEYKENDFPNYTISSDESGLASLFCTKDNDVYEYIFDNNKLIKIKETYTYKDNGNNEEYLNEFDKYTKLSNTINSNNGTSIITENINDFIFSTDIDLKNYNSKINNNYYSYNETVNKINFDMKAKGFDCK